jgi:hypothetical protein
LIALAISGVITGAITSTIIQVFNGNIRTSNHMTAVRQVQDAGYWVSYDAHMAQSIIFDDEDTSDTEFLTLTWADWGHLEGSSWVEGEVHRVAYTLEGTGEVGELWRDHNGQRSLVARFINTGSEKTNCSRYRCLICDEKFASLDELEAHFASEHPSEELVGNYENGALTFTVTATVGAGSAQEQSETRTYEIVPRPGA